MELIICFGLAISAFVLLIMGAIALINAPTPILLGILVIGVMLTQKSINKFTEPKISFIDEKEKDKIETVELASQDSTAETSEKKEMVKSMVYRGSNYQPHLNRSGFDRFAKKKQNITINYRGGKIIDRES